MKLSNDGTAAMSAEARSGNAAGGLAAVIEAGAQLWSRIYAAEYEALRETHNAPGARRVARREADAAVADFDARYGGKR